MLSTQNVGELTEVGTGRHWPVPEIHAQIETRRQLLAHHGLSRGDKVLIHFGNRLEFFAELIAIWSMGACAIPIDGRLTQFEINKIANASCARFSIVDDETADTTNDLDPNISVLNSLHACDKTMKLSSAPEKLFLDDDALILFTSGSTGKPKGVVHTHRSLQAKWVSLRETLGLDAYRNSLCVLPTHFGHGLICNCLFPWLAGCHLFVAPPFDTALLLQLGAVIDENEITFMSSVPSLWNLALRAPKSPEGKTLRRLHVGSAPLSASLWRQIQEWAGTRKVFNAYGITETGSWVAGTTGGEVVPESGLIGEPWGSSIKVLNLYDTAAPFTPDLGCASGDTGMIWLHTPALMKGYFQRQDLTDACVRQGWFMTGDIGAIDEQGRLFLKGRERDEINKGGMKVYPADIDEIVEQFEATDEVCTFGIEDELYGQNVAMAVVLCDESDETVRALQAWIESHIARHKHPIRWYVLDKIPRTSRGKINRDSVAQLCSLRPPLDLQRMIQ